MQNQIYQNSVAFLDFSTPYLSIIQNLRLNYTGKCYTMALFCGEPNNNNQAANLVLQGAISYLNEYGFLSANKQTEIIVYSVFTAVCFIASIIWGLWICCQKSEEFQNVFSLHFGFLFAFSIEILIYLCAVIHDNNNGEKSVPLIAVYFIINLLRTQMTFLSIFYISGGTGYKSTPAAIISDASRILLLVFFVCYSVLIWESYFNDFTGFTIAFNYIFKLIIFSIILILR